MRRKLNLIVGYERSISQMGTPPDNGGETPHESDG